MNKPIWVICVLLAAAAVLSACGAGSSSPNNTVQHLQIDSYSLGGSERVLNLRGPQNAYSQPVTYYIFGSVTQLGSDIVPLQSQRLDEQAIGPLAYGDSMMNVDLSPWAAYDFIYIRAIPVFPNVVIELAAGKRFDISTS